MNVRDVMSTSILEADINESIQQVAERMAKKEAGSAIITENNQPIGIVTETDFARNVVANALPINRPVSTIMSSPLFTTQSDTDVMEVANSMKENKIKKMPVEESGKIVGIITQTDVVNHVYSSMNQIHHHYSKGRLSPEEVAKLAQQLFSNFNPALEHMTKNWYMKCKQCGNKFLDAEHDGKLDFQECPECKSKDISYDLSPEI